MGLIRPNLKQTVVTTVAGPIRRTAKTKFYDNQTDNYWQHHYHLLATQRLSDRLNLNVTLHYTDGKGYYEDYKAGAKYASYKLDNYVDAKGGCRSGIPARVLRFWWEEKLADP